MTKGQKPMRVREPVERFAFLMEERLRANDHKGERGWEDKDLDWLLQRLGDEYIELRSAMAHDDWDAVRLEAADVANFAMMIVDRCS